MIPSAAVKNSASSASAEVTSVVSVTAASAIADVSDIPSSVPSAASVSFNTAASGSLCGSSVVSSLSTSSTF